ncbi:MAG: heme-binding protein [Isosphaeraceae bacterium]
MIDARWTVSVVFVMMLALAGSSSTAQEADAKARSEIQDTAKMFDPQVVQEAQAILTKAEQTTHLPVVIETVPSLDGADIEEMAARQARKTGAQGFFVLMSKNDKKFSTLVSRRQLASRLSTAERVTIRDAFAAEFRKGNFDAGLTRGATAIAEALARPTPAAVVNEAREDPSDAPLILQNQVRLTLAGARRVLAAAEAKAAEMKLKMNIAIVDDGGHLITFARMEGGRPASVATAMTKAITAATFRQATGPLPPGGEPNVLLNLSLQNAAAASGGKVTTLFGGVPIVVDGQVIGAVGVGGGHGEQDAEVARAGVDALLQDLKSAETVDEPK